MREGEMVFTFVFYLLAQIYYLFFSFCDIKCGISFSLFLLNVWISFAVSRFTHFYSLE